MSCYKTINMHEQTIFMWLKGLTEQTKFNPVFYLFYVEEVLGIKRNSSAGHRNILIQRSTITDIGPHRKCHWFSL